MGGFACSSEENACSPRRLSFDFCRLPGHTFCAVRKPTFLPLPALILAACAATGEGLDASPGQSGGQDASTLDAPFGDGSGCIVNGQVITVDPEQDWDGDGWAVNEGDCNDCDVVANPGAFDVPGNDVDEDCSGKPDDEPQDCDAPIAMTTNVPDDAARAIGICRFVHEEPVDPRDRTWGVVSAAFVQADGSPGMHHESRAVLANFGSHVHPQEGKSLLVLSSAAARRIGDDGYATPVDGQMGTTSATPAGWPREFPSCAQAVDLQPVAHDSAALALRIRVPTNAYSFSFRFAFFTTEFPSWICHQYNDYFVALLESGAENPGAQEGNLSFDAEGNPISVNTAFLEACRPQVVGDVPYACPLGDAVLAGNGFGPSDVEPRGHAGTGWLETTASVIPGEEIELRFAIWDAGDHRNGSTVVIDGFGWGAEAGSGPGTIQVK